MLKVSSCYTARQLTTCVIGIYDQELISNSNAVRRLITSRSVLSKNCAAYVRQPVCLALTASLFRVMGQLIFCNRSINADSQSELFLEIRPLVRSGHYRRFKGLQADTLARHLALR